MHPPLSQFETLDAAARRRAVHVREIELARRHRRAARRGADPGGVKPRLLRSLVLSR